MEIGRIKIQFIKKKRVRMMRKGIVIGAGRDAIHTIKKAREQGIYVVALDGNPETEGLKSVSYTHLTLPTTSLV